MAMRTLSIAALMTLSAMAALTHAQGTQQRRDADRRQAMQRLEGMLETRREERTTCALPDGSSHPLNAVVRYEEQTYRCLEVFTPTPAGLVPPGENQTLTVRIAGWVKLPVA
jgi:hypothetical protein